jgi:DNA-binding PadR family transcriptional regulator
MLGPPLTSLALILRALSSKEPLGLRDAEQALSRRTAGAIRFSTAIYATCPSMVRGGFITPTGTRPHPRSGCPVRLYRRTERGVNAAAVYAAAVRALYAMPLKGDRAAGALDRRLLRLHPPVTTATVTLEFLRAEPMTARQLADRYAAILSLDAVPSKFVHAMPPMVRAGLIEVLGARDAAESAAKTARAPEAKRYQLTTAGERRATELRALMRMLYGPGSVHRRTQRRTVTADALRAKRIDVQEVANKYGYGAAWVEKVLAAWVGAQA